MRDQYAFDPVEVELPFGEDADSPTWTIRLDETRSLELQGRIDRVDLCPAPDGQTALCVVLDYKSSEKRLDPLLLANGLQLQLLTYLNVMRRWPDPRRRFGVDRLIPAGVFYVSLRGKYERGRNRRDALADAALDRRLAYRHSGRFDIRVLRQLDSRSDAQEGDQFNYRLTKSGEPRKGSAEAIDPAEFIHLLDSVELLLRQMGQRIFAGDAQVAPYRKGSDTACRQCDYQSVCRMDPWTHSFRTLKTEWTGGG
jgi:ATP-dependent helicase/nuclease subunit B